MSDTPANEKQTIKIAIIPAIIALLAFLSAIGTGFQNATATVQLLIQLPTMAASNAWVLGIVAGGICSTVVNFFLNFELLEAFWERISGKKPLPHLPGIGQKLQYGIGITVFITTGILFALSAVSIGATGGIAIVAIVAGIFVSLVTIPQELETWLESFDDPVAVALGKKIYEVKAETDTENAYKLVNGHSGFPKELQKITLKAGLQKIKTALMLENNWTSNSKELDELNQKITELGEDKSRDSDYLDGLLNELIEGCKQIEKKGFTELQARIQSQQTKLSKFETKEAIQILDDLDDLKKLAEKDQPKISPLKGIKKWWLELTPGRFIGLIVSLGNTMGLSLLFTIGLTPALVAIGVAAFPALILGFCAAFTIGAFTEFYFYHAYLANFCDQIPQKWKQLIDSPNYGWGILTVLTNGTINGILGYTSVLLLGTLLAAAGIAAPPLLALAIVTGVFTGLASCLLGTDFWIRNAKRFAEIVTKFTGSEASSPTEDVNAKGYSPLKGSDEEANSSTKPQNYGNIVTVPIVRHNANMMEESQAADPLVEGSSFSV